MDWADLEIILRMSDTPYSTTIRGEQILENPVAKPYF